MAGIICDTGDIPLEDDKVGQAKARHRAAASAKPEGSRRLESGGKLLAKTAETVEVERYSQYKELRAQNSSRQGQRDSSII